MINYYPIESALLIIEDDIMKGKTLHQSMHRYQNQRQAFVKHSSDRSCELLSEDHLLNSQSSRRKTFLRPANDNFYIVD